jgi:hypothetical protein
MQMGAMTIGSHPLPKLDTFNFEKSDSDETWLY